MRRECEARDGEQEDPCSSPDPIDLQVAGRKEEHAGEHFDQKHEYHLLREAALSHEVQVVQPDAHHVVTGQDGADEHHDDDEDSLLTHQRIEAHGKLVQPAVTCLQFDRIGVGHDSQTETDRGRRVHGDRQGVKCEAEVLEAYHVFGFDQFARF